LTQHAERGDWARAEEEVRANVLGNLQTGDIQDIKKTDVGPERIQTGNLDPVQHV
jgi:hypothetical protein